MDVDKVLDGLIENLGEEEKAAMDSRADELNSCETIKEACEVFIKQTVPEEILGTAFENEYRKAFYGGVSTLMMRVLNVPQKESMSDLLQDIDNALEDFSADMLMKSLEVKGSA